MLGLRMSEILRLYCSIVILTTSSTSNFFHERLEDSERGPIHLSSTEEACKQVNAPNGHRQHKPWSNKQVFCFGPLLYTCGFLKSSILIGLSMINQFRDPPFMETPMSECFWNGVSALDQNCNQIASYCVTGAAFTATTRKGERLLPCSCIKSQTSWE